MWISLNVQLPQVKHNPFYDWFECMMVLTGGRPNGMRPTTHFDSSASNVQQYSHNMYVTQSWCIPSLTSPQGSPTFPHMSAPSSSSMKLKK